MNAKGIDVSSWQNDLLPATLAPYDFGYAKATQGLTFTDPHFAANWAALAEWGKPRGAYHFLVPSADPIAQASYFVSAVKAAGLKTTDILVCDSETAAAKTDADTKAFLDRVRALCPYNPILTYSYLSFLPSIASAASYPLWLADYTSATPTEVAPWGKWLFWQYAEAPAPDKDMFNGSAADLAAWIATYQPAKPAASEATVITGTINATEAGRAVSLPEGSCNFISLFADPTLTGKAASQIRVAAHSKAKGFSQVVARVMVTGTKAVVTFKEADVDGVSLRRVDDSGNWAEIGYNLG